jgi:hypothetical protein
MGGKFQLNYEEQIDRPVGSKVLAHDHQNKTVLLSLTSEGHINVAQFFLYICNARRIV